ncbi:hypothetical protein MPER_05381, partial [Moniliophthora perniciosa FA553]
MASTSQIHTLFSEAVEQCKLYREVLISRSLKLWKHIVGNLHPDPGLWSTGNAWAAAGMTRVLATVLRAPTSLVSASQKRTWTNDLTSMIKEIVDPEVSGYYPYLEWADATRETLGEGHVTSEGIVRPAVNPLGWDDREPRKSQGDLGLLKLMYGNLNQLRKHHKVLP